ncbi:accessory gene regulator B family protein [[Ruminococcus] torques]|uniref:accessory gene regulator B family protein n=1 Tax=[Ruminococcus] torques TaxID=33039 RepID=UPI0023B0EC4F|nr:accessory gene regulator B family protein [[Ruminococcus] torques]MDE8707717.1 accessory gene regulator B family protein [[Ruminococcus] torques]
MKNKREERFEAIVDQFVKNDLIAQEEYSYYLYGVKHLEVLIMTTGGVLLSGILLKEILFTVVFLITVSV